MGRKLPRYAYAERDRHGKLRYYFRRSKGHPRVALPAPDTPEFEPAYISALSGVEPPQRRTHGVNSLSWLIKQYRASSKYTGLSSATRRQRDNIFRGVERANGNKPYRDVSQKHIVAGRERRAQTPAQARNFLDAMRGLFAWAVESELLQKNPAANVKNPPRPKGPGFAAWSQEDVDKYRAYYPLGARERVWFEVLIGTGARRGDAVALVKTHIKNGLIEIETEKEKTRAYVPVLPEMIEAIEAGGTGDMVLLVGKTGKPLKKESFGNMFRTMCNAAGVNKSAHGLRKYVATRYAEMGLSDAELEAIFGWVRGSGMAAHYSKNAQRRRMAMKVAEEIRNTNTPNLLGSSPNLKKDVV